MGCPGRSITLLSFCGINDQILDYIADSLYNLTNVDKEIDENSSDKVERDDMEKNTIKKSSDSQ